MSNQDPKFNVDDLIIEYLAKGLTQIEVSNELKLKGITPNSLSLIEKKLKALRKEHRAATTFHLAVILLRKGLIK